MTHTPENSPQSTLGRALGLGAVAGVRSMSAPALLSRAASRGNIEGIEDTPFAFLASSRAARILTVLAVGEALADKLPFSPDRISPPGLIGRMASGGLVGAALFAAAGHRATIGAGLGLLSAAAASYPPTTCGSRLKRNSACRTGLWAWWRTSSPRAAGCWPSEVEGNAWRITAWQIRS
jgi:uncharacterized membrane protein